MAEFKSSKRIQIEFCNLVPKLKGSSRFGALYMYDSNNFGCKYIIHTEVNGKLRVIGVITVNQFQQRFWQFSKKCIFGKKKYFLTDETAQASWSTAEDTVWKI